MKYESGYKYLLKETEWCQLDLKPDAPVLTPYCSLTTEGILSVYVGYAWDGPSGPTLDTKDVMTPSLIHDCLYQLMAEGFLPSNYRRAADKELTRLMKERGVNWLRRKIWWRGVRLAGGAHLEPKKIREAP